jgi:hypothetical protein
MWVNLKQINPRKMEAQGVSRSPMIEFLDQFRFYMISYIEVKMYTLKSFSYLMLLNIVML